MADFKTDEDKAKFCQRQMGFLEEIRRPYEHMVDEVIRLVNHGRRKIVDNHPQNTMNANKGKNTGIDVYDGTALSAANLAADGIHGYMCSSSIHWFDLTLPGKMNFPRTSGMSSWSGKRLDEYPEVKVWLDDCEEVLYSAFLRSNFYDFHPDYTREGITIGTATAVIEEDVENNRIIFTLPHFRECYICENQFGQVDTHYRKYKMTLRQLVQKFGAEKVFKLDINFKNQYEKNPYTEKEVIHATFPRTDYDPKKLNGSNKPVASIWLLPSSTYKIIDESGYWELPKVTWRWRKNADEIYGRSPAWDAYVGIMKGNQQAKSNLIAGHKMAEPPMTAPEDLRGKVRPSAAGWTWISGNVTKDKVPVPLQTGIQLPFAIDQQERTDKAIKEHFHVDFFLMLYQAAFNKVDLTATQVLGMQGEQAAVLGTRIGRHQSEGLNPIMDRVFAIENRAGRLPAPPQILLDYGGQNMEIDYLGPLSQAQRRLFKMQGIRAGIEIASQIATVFPSSVDIIDGDQTMKEALEAVGFPAKTFRNEGQVDTIRQIRQKKQMEQEAIEQMEQVAKAAQRVTKSPEEGSILDDVKQRLEGEAA
ncbi:head-tail connector protein [Patescibacteria group bacterium]|nr:head-tail connector protein [Patescibacteria group bacterium]